MIDPMERPTPAAEYSIVPANQASYEDLFAIFGTRGYTATCQCQRFKVGPYPWRLPDVPARVERARTAGQ